MQVQLDRSMAALGTSRTLAPAQLNSPVSIKPARMDKDDPDGPPRYHLHSMNSILTTTLIPYTGRSLAGSNTKKSKQTKATVFLVSHSSVTLKEIVSQGIASML